MAAFAPSTPVTLPFGCLRICFQRHHVTAVSAPAQQPRAASGDSRRNLQKSDHDEIMIGRQVIAAGSATKRGRTRSRRVAQVDSQVDISYLAASGLSRSAASYSRFAQPVPKPLPHEILPVRRGRNARKHVMQAEYFRQYMFLRRQLKPWSEEFRAIHGRIPNLEDVHEAGVPGLLDRFVEYLEALEKLRS